MITAIESLQGAWQIESLELAGAPVGASGRIVIDQNHFTSTGMGAEYTGRLELTSPNKITLHFETGPEAGVAEAPTGGHYGSAAGIASHLGHHRHQPAADQQRRRDHDPKPGTAHALPPGDRLILSRPWLL